jgi:hypothetical protein
MTDSEEDVGVGALEPVACVAPDRGTKRLVERLGCTIDVSRDALRYS